MIDSFIEELREQSPTLQKVIYLNHASTCPLHGRIKQATLNYLDFWTKYDFHIAIEKREKSRELFARIINASKDEITLTPDVTHGSKLVANMVDFEEKDNIVCFWNDYPGQVYQALHLEKNKNIEYRKVPDRKNVIEPEDFANKIDENTKLVLLSHVQWLSGCKADIKEITKIAHENDAFVLVDTIQSSGAILNDVKAWDVDFLTCGTAKWLLGPDQKGFFYMKKKLIDNFNPPFAGYHGTDKGSEDEPYWNVNELKYLNSIDKFMDTNPGCFLYYLAYEGMNILLDYGVKNVQERIFKLTDYLIEELQSLNPIEFITPLEMKYRSGIVNVRLPNNIDLARKLKENKIIVSPRYGGIRISPHFYNTFEDIDKLVSILKQTNI
ncbi:MAG: aminotransferase class V-fold PLP-dependent enzyme [Candidatus Heimdallarchaeaceae archaeon]